MYVFARFRYAWNSGQRGISVSLSCFMAALTVFVLVLAAPPPPLHAAPYVTSPFGHLIADSTVAPHSHHRPDIACLVSRLGLSRATNDSDSPGDDKNSHNPTSHLVNTCGAFLRFATHFMQVLACQRQQQTLTVVVPRLLQFPHLFARYAHA
ncbi:hypothetical protein [Salinivibrio costicola]|uniref:DUF2607 family protein n=1 Tax=Salinivibrio costicola TaxID=51367 RepID=A0ABX6K448_SALCS|nr:hypothetical protein [Salinivibrio costicola]QIR06329.1 hypothetical protein HBA18_08030 [Salinivibrio costicola]